METGQDSIIEEKVILDNKERVFLAHKKPLKDSDGTCIGVIGTATDITRLKEMEIELKKAKVLAESNNKLKTQFIADMEHDLRTPCSGISEMTKLLEASETNPERKETLGYVAQASSRLLEILDSILTFDQIETGQYPIINKKFSIHKILQDTIAIEMPSAKTKKIKLTGTCSHDVPDSLIGDEHRISRIILNLVSNAIKFTIQGRVDISIKLTEKLDDQNAIIHIIVTDTGIGIPKDKKQLIYERFSRIKPANNGEFTGTGLGLSIVKRFVDDLKGEIYVESTLGQGTKFTCTLPIKFPLLNNQPTIAKIQTKQHAIAPLNKKLSILLVEDDSLAQVVTLTILKKSFNVRVNIANTGAEALKLSNNNKYDLILMDVGLPDTDGYKATNKIRNNKNNKNNNSLIIALTAHKSEDAKKTSINSGMDDFLVKPLNVEKIQAIINRWILNKLGKEKQDHKPNNQNKQNCKIIDLELGAKLVGGQKEKALEMLEALTQELPNDLELIKTAFKDNKLAELSKIVHKLHGGVCYCGTPGLKKITEQLELSTSSENKEEIEKNYHKLCDEIQAVLDCYKNIKL